MKIFILILLLCPFCLRAQQAPLMIEGKTGSLYLVHVAAPKENLYSIGRLYNISPKIIAPFNKFKSDKGISIGEAVKIPLQAGNFVQSVPANATDALIPVYHKVLPEETLYRLSVQFNKVPVAFLKAQNKITEDAVSPGQNIIVGYLVVKNGVSSLAEGAAIIQKEDNEPIVTTPPPVEEHIVANGKAPDKKTKSAKDKKIKTEKLPPVVTADIPETVTPAVLKNFKDGAFKSLYKSSGNEETVTAGVFKSLSGWSDGKYYCLHNTIAPGTVIKITDGTTGKSVFAKVLDAMPDLKQNRDIGLLLCDAAAESLSQGSTNFNCTINY